jgi:metal-dependent amidase/aminoacylase/carboxypeptidase family protein
VPATAAMNWYIRSGTLESLQPLMQRVLTCLKGAADACEVEMTYEWVGIPYADMIDNVSMVQAYTSNAARLGRVVLDPAQAHKVTGSTDMGNVSYLVPSIHPMIKVAEHGVPIHSTRFAEFAGGEGGDRAVIDGAKAMAMTVVDLWTSPDLLARATAEFERRPTGMAAI